MVGGIRLYDPAFRRGSLFEDEKDVSLSVPIPAKVSDAFTACIAQPLLNQTLDWKRRLVKCQWVLFMPFWLGLVQTTALEMRTASSLQASESTALCNCQIDFCCQASLT
jgi:hypothetical protein